MTGWTPTDAAARVLKRFVGRDVGIVAREYERLCDADDVRGFAYGAHATDATPLLGQSVNLVNGGGGPSRVGARLAAIGETLERYSAAWLPEPAADGADAARAGDPWFGAETELRAAGHDVVGQADVELFTPEQLDDSTVPFERDDPARQRWWRRGRRVGGGAVFVPAQLVHLRGDWGAESPLAYATSNGLACGVTPEEAAVSGLLEVIERDAFMIAWHGSLSLPRIDPAGSPRIEGMLARHVDPAGLALALVDLSGFSGVPVVLAVVRGPRGGDAPIALGAAAAATVERAAEKAAFEAMHTRSWTRSLAREGQALHDADWAADVRSFEDHVRLYAGTELVPAADFLDASAETVPASSLPRLPDATPGALLDALAERVRAAGASVVLVDATSPDVAEGGASVVRAIVPGFCPIDAPYAARFLGPRRLREAPVAAGLRDAPPTPNPIPHPFP